MKVLPKKVLSYGGKREGERGIIIKLLIIIIIIMMIK